ncbi:phosphoribosylanthranilate isomerase [uncultured Ruminococcus sp.]|uniref:phosphoribosylanthranilate isomerase n=1 Tax=uncultured Ruminococcus sp. TaxID=165186 RepID=UPI000EC10DD1|nr:phosphoribosylanthranilate isomerase [uncultured Ruminococcus sp.]HCJ40200.1 phosphoribosylanthranilate isomerase [Ruminococcus sp.]
MPVKIKICGLTSAEDARYVSEAGAELAGMVVFFPKSKRNVSLEKAAEIKAALSADVRTCAVTVSPSVEQVRQINSAGFDYIQIHGALDDDAYEAAEIPIIKAFNVTDISEFDRYRSAEKVCGYVFDAAEYGSGKSFDWALLDGIERDGRAFILAGGLRPDNVAEAVKRVSPDFVDVSSGVENDSGSGKDRAKILDFVKNARNV